MNIIVAFIQSRCPFIQPRDIRCCCIFKKTTSTSLFMAIFCYFFFITFYCILFVKENEGCVTMDDFAILCIATVDVLKVPKTIVWSILEDTPSPTTTTAKINGELFIQQFLMKLYTIFIDRLPKLSSSIVRII